jgi:hypothetical protein
MSISKYAFKKCHVAKIIIVQCPGAKLPAKERKQGVQRATPSSIFVWELTPSNLSGHRALPPHAFLSVPWKGKGKTLGFVIRSFISFLRGGMVQLSHGALSPPIY